MKKNEKSVNELIQERSSMIAKREALNISMCAIADKAAAEKRELTAEENVEYQKMQSDFHKIGREIAMNVDLVNMMNAKPKTEKSKNMMLREALQGAMGSQQKEFVVKREWTEGVDMAELAAGGMVPLTIKDILPPLEMGLIWDKVGIPMETGVVGDISWPVMGSVEASIIGEKEELTDTGVDLSNIKPKKERLGITIPITYQAINDTNSNLLGTIQTQARMGFTRLLNRVAFSHQNFTSTFHGPFAGAKASGTFAGKVPTLAELLQMKGKVAAEGVEMSGFCYVMSENMKAVLEATPIDAGSGRMIIENGTIKGYPVFTTEYINYGSNKQKAEGVEYIAAGCFGYLAANQYGDLRIVVNPYSRAKEDIVEVTINGDWSMTTLRVEAFALWKTA
jgi:HK97 family phage major capsid protein